MPIPDEFSPKSQIYHLDKLTGTLHKQPNENTIKVLIGQSSSKSGKLEPKMVRKTMDGMAIRFRNVHDVLHK